MRRQKEYALQATWSEIVGFHDEGGEQVPDLVGFCGHIRIEGDPSVSLDVMSKRAVAHAALVEAAVGNDMVVDVEVAVYGRERSIGANSRVRGAWVTEKLAVPSGLVPDFVKGQRSLEPDDMPTLPGPDDLIEPRERNDG